MKCILAVVLFAAVASAGRLDFYPSTNFNHPEYEVDKDLRIVGGREVPPHAVPYQVGLFMGNSFCGGSLINERYVLTSAHCARLSDRPVVVLGAHRIKEKEREQVTMTAAKVIVHPHYSSSTFQNDIALVMLPQPVRFNDYINPIYIAPPNSGFFENSQSRVTGWGVTSDNSKEMSPVLMYTLNPILPNRECQRRLGNLVEIGDRHLCFSGENGRSPSLGDAGAPVVAEYQSDLYQVGIVSFMMENQSQKGYPVGLTRVGAFYNWIVSNM